MTESDKAFYENPKMRKKLLSKWVRVVPTISEDDAIQAEYISYSNINDLEAASAKVTKFLRKKGYLTCEHQFGEHEIGAMGFEQKKCLFCDYVKNFKR